MYYITTVQLLRFMTKSCLVIPFLLTFKSNITKSEYVKRQPHLGNVYNNTRVECENMFYASLSGSTLSPFLFSSTPRHKILTRQQHRNNNQCMLVSEAKAIQHHNILQVSILENQLQHIHVRTYFVHEG